MIRPILGSAAAVIHNCASCLAKECPQNPPPSRHPANGTQRGSGSCGLSATSPHHLELPSLTVSTTQNLLQQAGYLQAHTVPEGQDK